MTTPRSGPRSGGDTYDLTGDALFKLAERRGAWLGDDLTAITLIASLIGQAERFLPELVTNARLNGHPWARSPRHWPPAPTRHGSASAPNPRSPTPDGPTTFSHSQRTRSVLHPAAPADVAGEHAARGRPQHSPAAALSPPAQPQVQVERPQRSEDERPGGAASGGHNRATRNAAGEARPHR